MAKKSKSSKSKSKKDAAAAAAKKEQEAATKAAKRARERAKQLADEAKDLRKSAFKAARKADKAEGRAADARRAAGLDVPEAAAPKPDETELLRLALRSAEARLTDTERRLEAAEQQLRDRDREDEEAVEEALEDAVVDAAVEATVADAVADAVAEAQLEGDAVTDVEIVEAVAVELDEAADQAEPAPEEPSHEGEAQAAAEVFEQAGTDGDAVTDGSGTEEGGAAPADAGDADPVFAEDAAEDAPPLPSAPSDDEPSESWTLLRLRGEAKQRGLTGTSNLSKAALLARLREG